VLLRFANPIGLTPDGNFVAASLPGMSLDNPGPGPFSFVSGGGKSGTNSALGTPTRGGAGVQLSPRSMALQSRASPYSSIEKLPRSYSALTLSTRMNHVTVYVGPCMGW
jgi:hypothetical protein